MARMTPLRDWTLEIVQDWIDVSSDLPVIDERWVGVDSHGHRHEGARLEDTLRPRYSKRHWCELCRDEHNDFLGWFCRKCRERVHPGTTSAPGGRIPGLRTTMVVLMVGNTQQTWFASDEVSSLLLANPTMPAAEVLALLDADGGSHWTDTRTW